MLTFFSCKQQTLKMAKSGCSLTGEPACEWTELKLEETNWKGWASRTLRQRGAADTVSVPFGEVVCFLSVTVRHGRALFHGLQAFVSVLPCASPDQGFSSETVWVGTPPVRLSACLPRCCSAPSSRLPLSTWASLLCTALFWTGFFSCRARGALFSFQVLETGDFGPVLLVWARGGNGWRKADNIDHTCTWLHKTRLSLSFSVRFPEELLFVFLWSG